MLRTLVFAPAAILALGAPMMAKAEDFHRAAVGTEVHADDGTVIGRVTAVTRDRAGNVVSAEIPGLEPPSASDLHGPMIAENDARVSNARVIDMRPRGRARIDQTAAHERSRVPFARLRSFSAS